METETFNIYLTFDNSIVHMHEFTIPCSKLKDLCGVQRQRIIQEYMDKIVADKLDWIVGK